MFRKTKITRSQRIKIKARRSLRNMSLNGKGKFQNFPAQIKNYVIDTSAIIHKFLPRLISKGMQGKMLIPNAVMAELENLANKGREEGFLGLEEIAKLHKIKQIKVYFEGLRPTEMQIKFAKSGEIDALIREVAIKNKATLITADLVQAKSTQAYGLEVLFLRTKFKKQEKKRFLFFKKFRKHRKHQKPISAS